jgi:Amt family ammonium transporter
MATRSPSPTASIHRQLRQAFLNGVTISSMAATFSKETYIPEFAYLAFQLTFAAITPALIVGAFAERMKFSAVLLFMVIWFTFSYLPMAHMVWWWAGPDCFTLSPEAIDTVKACVGEAAATDFLAKLAAAADDAAKATVLGRLRLCRERGQRLPLQQGRPRLRRRFRGAHQRRCGRSCLRRHARQAHRPRQGSHGSPQSHSCGHRHGHAADLGWFGFNAGSNLEANGLTALVLLNTILGAAAATLAWCAGEWLTRGHASFLGAASGMVAGLVAITPACGWVGPMSAIVIGLLAGIVCLFAVIWLKAKLGYDDALDVFGVHGIGGILGALLTGIFVNPNWSGGWQGMGVTDYLATDTSTKLLDYAFRRTDDSPDLRHRRRNRALGGCQLRRLDDLQVHRWLACRRTGRTSGSRHHQPWRARLQLIRPTISVFQTPASAGVFSCRKRLITPPFTPS